MSLRPCEHLYEPAGSPLVILDFVGTHICTFANSRSPYLDVGHLGPNLCSQLWGIRSLWPLVAVAGDSHTRPTHVNTRKAEECHHGPPGLAKPSVPWCRIFMPRDGYQAAFAVLIFNHLTKRAVRCCLFSSVHKKTKTKQKKKRGIFVCLPGRGSFRKVMWVCNRFRYHLEWN